MTTRQKRRSRRGPSCERCGCNQHHACVDIDLRPCHWFTPSLCSHCAAGTPAWKPGMKLYQGAWIQGSISIVVRELVLDRTGPTPLIVNELATALVWCPELLRASASSPRHEIAASLLRDCLDDAALARRLYPRFADEVLADWHQDWILNEFEIRHWSELIAPATRRAKS